MNKNDAILRELNLIMKNNGGMLNPKDVVEFAKNKNTVLHTCFTWDDTEAAVQWRLQQARQIIRVSITVLDDGDKTEYRTFVSLKEDRYGHMGYRPTISVLKDEDLRNIMLSEAIGEMEVFKEKYKDLKELVTVFVEMDSVIQKVRRPKAKGVIRPQLRA